MSPENLIILESGARVSSALVLGVFLVVAVRTVVHNLDRGRSETQEEMDRLRATVQDLGWQVDRLHERQVERLRSLEQRLDFTEQLIGRPPVSLEARH
jgi:uncharacterized protein YlxW (UPF0749 family)